MGKQTLHHLCDQHNLNVDPKSNTESMKATIVDHIASGRCQASTSSLCLAADDEYHSKKSGANGDLEAYIINHAAHAKKVKPSKKTLRRILKSKGIEFDDDDEVGDLRRHLRSYLTTLHKAKRPEWDRNHRAEQEAEHWHHLDKIQEEWPQPAAMELKEDCVHNFRAATSSDSLCQFTCAWCAESVNISDRKVRQLTEINLELMRDHTDRVFDKSCILPKPPFTDGPLFSTRLSPCKYFVFYCRSHINVS